MTGSAIPEHVLARLRSIDWEDADRALDCARSRGALMREFLRRSALWARQYGVEGEWPFFDVAAYAAPESAIPQPVADEVSDELRRRVDLPSTRRVCEAAVRWASISTERAAALPDLPEPYEPLLLMFERGGGYAIKVSIDLYGVMIPYGTFETNLNSEPFLTLDVAVLDALDSHPEGAVRYFAVIDELSPRSRPMGLVRRRVVRRDREVYDEAFTRNLRWEPTDYLERYRLGHDDEEHVQISVAEAAAFVERVLRRQTVG